MVNKKNIIAFSAVVIAIIGMLIYSEFPFHKNAITKPSRSLERTRQLAAIQSHISGYPGWHETLAIRSGNTTFNIDTTSITHGISYSHIILGDHDAYVISLATGETFLKADKDFWQTTHAVFTRRYLKAWTRISPELLGADLGKLTNVFEIARSLYNPSQPFTYTGSSFRQGDKIIIPTNDQIEIQTTDHDTHITQIINPATTKELTDAVEVVSRNINFLKWTPDERFNANVDSLQIRECLQGKTCRITANVSLDDRGYHSSKIDFVFYRDEGPVGSCISEVRFHHINSATTGCTTVYYWPPTNNVKRSTYNSSDYYQTPGETVNPNPLPLPPESPRIPLPEVKYSATTFSSSHATALDLRALRKLVVTPQRPLTDEQIVFQYSQSMDQKQELIYQQYGVANSHVHIQGRDYDAKIAANRLVSFINPQDFLDKRYKTRIDSRALYRKVSDLMRHTPRGYTNELMTTQRVISILNRNGRIRGKFIPVSVVLS